MSKKNKEPVTFLERRRLALLAMVLVGLFALLLTQFYRLQIIQGDYWEKRGERQHFFIVTEPFLRGRFFSNPTVKRGHPESPKAFVADIRMFHLYADPLSIDEKNHAKIVEALKGILALNGSEMEKLADQLLAKSRSRTLAMWLAKEKKEEIEKWWRPFAKKNKIPSNALFFVADYKRSYPFGKMLGQVLHTIQERKDETTKQAVPTGGLELCLNPYLKGCQGKRILMRSPRHSFEMGEVVKPPVHGADVFLTINHCLQAICEEEIEAGVKECGAKYGWAAMMDPRTGEVLAVAQYPFFYPDDYSRFFKDSSIAETTKVKALTDAQEPGSVMKPITCAIALMANEEMKKRGEPPLFTPEEIIPTASGAFPGRSKPIKDTKPHKQMNMDMALQKSSNIYMGRIVHRVILKLGDQWYRKALAESFGFGKRTFLELPAESPGVLPTPGKLHPNGKLEWSVPTPFSLAIGHNLQVNSFQLLRAISVFANRGILVEPTLVRKIVRTAPDGSEELILDNTDPERISKFKRVISKEIAERVVRGMKFVTKPGGGGFRGEVYGYTEAGKTGTANKIVGGQYSKKNYISTFIGFTPVVKPAFVLLVTMDEPDISYKPGVGHTYYSGICTAPVFSRIATRALEYMGVEPDDPHGYPPKDPRYDEKKADWIAETKKLQEMTQKWNN